jgi:hypothetical protein
VHIYATTLAAPAGSTASSARAELIRDALWAHASSLSDIEHITVTVLPEGIGIGIFLSHLAENPEDRARALLRAAARRSPVMNPWREAIEGEADFHVNNDPADRPGNGARPHSCPGSG